MVQRVLVAKTPWHARQGVLLAGFLKMFSPFLICFPGMAARALWERRCNASKTSGAASTTGPPLKTNDVLDW
ncbi:unnamed protein product, partial [Amoebophrya sp. A25]|eukprot:GSA25T00008302001.1